MYINNIIKMNLEFCKCYFVKDKQNEKTEQEKKEMNSFKVFTWASKQIAGKE